MPGKWRDKDVYAHHIKYTYKEVKQKLKNYALASKYRNAQEIWEMLIKFIDTTSRRKKGNKAYLGKFQKEYEDRLDLDFKLLSLKFSMIEQRRRYRIRLLRKAKRIYKNSAPLSRKFKTAVGINRFNPKILKKPITRKRSPYIFPSSYKLQKRFAANHQYSHKELLQLNEHYSAFTKDLNHQNALFKITDDYRKNKREKYEVRTLRNNRIIRKMGSPLEGEPIIHELIKEDEIEDQKARNLVVKKTKAYYHKNYSLSKKFKDAQSKTNVKKEKDVEKIK